MRVFNVLISGVGGQGVLLTSKIIAEAALLAGLDVKQNEVHGMAQRGGSVLSQVRYGEKVFSPIISEGEANLLIGFEPLETARYLHFLKEGAVCIYNTKQIGTIGVSIGSESYPSDIGRIISERVKWAIGFDATRLAIGSGEKRALNLVLLGASLEALNLPSEIVEVALEKTIPKKVFDVNLKAFNAGREYIKYYKGSRQHA